MPAKIAFVILASLAAVGGGAQNYPKATVVNPSYRLTARPWIPLNLSRDKYLDSLEGMCRFTVNHQDADGAIIDIFTHNEQQYSTPYFAYAAGTLVRAGRAKDLLPHGIAAMEHSTQQFERGRMFIPGLHSEFFIGALAESIGVYRSLVPSSTLEKWRSRLRAPIESLVGPVRSNWMTYSMKGQWLRYREGLVTHDEAVGFIEQSWRSEQRMRVLTTPFHLYHDRSSDPDSLSVEAVGRGNLLALIEEGYDGPSSGEIRLAAEDGTRTSLLLQDPTGQAPANGRTDDHTWVDVGYQLAFQGMAESEWEAGRMGMAEVYQHASELSFNSIARWRRTDGEWAGSYFITKNHFDPSLRVGYQDASGIANYTGALMFHLAESYNARRHDIPEAAAPAEIGGYVIELDKEFDSVVANAGGLEVQMNLRGQTAKSSGNFWTPLGIVRISRTGWDSRIGPADGAMTGEGELHLRRNFGKMDSGAAWRASQSDTERSGRQNWCIRRWYAERWSTGQSRDREVQHFRAAFGSLPMVCIARRARSPTMRLHGV